jgi:hypothetical protein
MGYEKSAEPGGDGCCVDGVVMRPATGSLVIPWPTQHMGHSPTGRRWIITPGQEEFGLMDEGQTSFHSVECSCVQGAVSQTRARPLDGACWVREQPWRVVVLVAILGV